LLALTGLTRKEFGALHQAFRTAYATVYPEDKTADGSVRKRQVGGGRKGQLGTTEQKLLFSLVYLKTYPLQALLGELFGLSQSRANRWWQRLLPMVKQALEDLGVLPSREPAQFAKQERGRQEGAAQPAGQTMELSIDHHGFAECRVRRDNQAEVWRNDARSPGRSTTSARHPPTGQARVSARDADAGRASRA